MPDTNRVFIFITGIWPATTSKKPVNQWPPPLPTHPPSSLPTLPPTLTTTKYPVHQDPGYCGTKNGNQDQERIVGGQTAAPNEWPWAVALFNGQRQFCGGKCFRYIDLRAIRALDQFSLKYNSFVQ